MTTTRRNFLKHSLGTSALVSLTPAVPALFLNTSAHAAAARRTSDNILVVVQLSGGNDGINTVIPHGDDVYHRSRNVTRYQANQVLKIDSYHGLHPQMTGFKSLYDEGQLAIVQGVGYPNPNRSHFESMDIWHTAKPTGEGRVAGRETGWIGRYLDAQRAAAKSPKNDDELAALHLGAGRLPLALAADKTRVPTVTDLTAFKLQTRNDGALRRTIESATRFDRGSDNDLLSYVQHSTVNALASSAQVQDALRQYSTPIAYPQSPLGQQLRTVAQLIEAGMSTRVYYVSLGGFDTHATQRNAHAALLKTLSDAVAAFTKDMAHHGHDKRVITMSFTEFGRRVKENASAGTDHGAANPLFLVGGGVKAGLIGKHPSMTDLDQGDLKFHTDFRAIYATLLKQWLGLPNPEAVLGGKFGPAKVLG